MKHAISLLLCLAVLLPDTVRPHTQGLHGLSNEQPSGKPVLPAITGAFEVEMNVRFNSLPGNFFTKPYATLFHFYNDGANSSIRFGHRNNVGVYNGRTLLEVIENGSSRQCKDNDNIVNLGEFYNYKFGVHVNGTAWIKQNGNTLVVCSGFTVPTATPRAHQYLGLSPLFDPGGNTYFAEPHEGAISGVRITNAASTPQQHPRERFKFLNFPGQVLSSGGSGFVASFYARFDDLSRSGQAVFDFGNDPSNDNIFCTQVSDSTTLKCGIFQGENEYSISLPNALVQGQFAFYHFSVTATGLSSLQKDNETAVTGSFGVAPSAIFRGNLGFCDSNWNPGEDLAGVVLGFRLDPTRVS